MKISGRISCIISLIVFPAIALTPSDLTAQSNSDPASLLDQYLDSGSSDVAERIREEMPGSPYDRFCDAWEWVGTDNMKALMLADSLINDAEDFAPGYFLRGMVKLKGFRKPSEAIAAFDECIERDDSFPWAYENRGIARLEQQDYEAARPDFEKLIKLRRGYARAYLLRGVAHHGMGELEAMIADFEIGLQLDYEALAPIYHSIARPAMDQAIEHAPENAIFHFARGYANFVSEDYRQASRDFQKCIELAPGSSEFYKYAGASKMYLKDEEEGQKDLNYALSVNPDDPQIYYYLGVLMNDYLGQSGRALEYMNNAISLDDRNARYFYERAKASADLMSLESARDDINRALLLNHRVGDFYALRGQIRKQLGRPAEDYCPDFRNAMELGTSYKLKRVLRRNCR